MSFQPYQFRELNSDGKAPVPARFEEPSLLQRKNSADADASHRVKNHFNLDQNVAGQLGIHERERQEAEDKISRELERRWEATSEKAEVEGYTKGLEEGKAEAFKAELPRIAEKIQRLDSILQEFDSMRSRIFTANEAFLMEVISQVAGMVALRAVESDPDYLRRLITQLLHQLATKEDLKIFLAEADLHNVDELRASLEKEFGKLTNTSIEVGPDVQAGGCKIETRFGVVDASLTAQVANAIKTLKA
jgi:flagellar assembly protein FliH